MPRSCWSCSGSTHAGRTGQPLANRRRDDRTGDRGRRGCGLRARGCRLSNHWRNGPGAAARRARPAARRGAAAAKAARSPGHARSRQDPGRGPRRGAGDDRHLRLRRRPVAPALRPHHRQRAARPPDDGAVASARARCCVITAFNFPVAVWAWNAALALVCGDPVIWKPSEKTPLTRWPVRQLIRRAVRSASATRRTVWSSCVQGGRRRRRGAGRRSARCARLGDRLDRDGPGGRRRVVAQRFGRSLLELGGNNATIVCPSADLDLAVRAIALLRRRHGRPALHDAAAADRRTKASPTSSSTRLKRLFASREDRRSARQRHAGRPADRRRGVRTRCRPR